MKTDRVRAIDAARGIAMFFVCLSHFATVYFRESHASTALLVATSVSMVASPTFMIISGLVLGFLYRIHREDFRRIKNKLLDRGLFLLTIGHIFIGLSHFRASAGGVTHAFASSVITDSIGLNLILGPIFIARVGPSRRLLVAVSLYVMSWSIVLRWQPETPGLEVLKQILFGPLTSYPAYDFDTPLVPWFSLYMVASCLGEWLGASHLEKNEARVKAVLIRLGAGSLSLAVLTAGGYELLRAFHLVASHPILYVLLSPFTKRPPSPAYFAFYGGASLLILRVCFELERVTLLNKVIEGARMIGETSLFAFIVEYYVYFALLDWMHLPVTVFWPAYFIVSVILIGVVCSVWYTNGYNRFLTVGFLRIAEGSLTQASAAPRWSHAGQ